MNDETVRYVLGHGVGIEKGGVTIAPEDFYEPPPRPRMDISGFREALGRTISSIMRTRPLRSEEVRRILRIEVNHDAKMALLEWVHSYGLTSSQAMRERVGPMQFEGVDVYIVPDLPDPGWRIINPLGI